MVSINPDQNKRRRGSDSKDVAQRQDLRIWEQQGRRAISHCLPRHHGRSFLSLGRNKVKDKDEVNNGHDRRSKAKMVYY